MTFAGSFANHFNPDCTMKLLHNRNSNSHHKYRHERQIKRSNILLIMVINSKPKQLSQYIDLDHEKLLSYLHSPNIFANIYINSWNNHV